MPAKPTWVPLGDRAIRFARPQVPGRVLVDAVRAWPGVVDVVVARHDVAAYFADQPHVDDARIAALAALHAPPGEPREVTIKVVYDGPDIEAIATALQLMPDDVVQLHLDATYTVDTIGFAPGFAYLAGLDERLHLPRRATPRPKVPAGSVAVADAFSAVYPFDSPGGWHLIGRVVGVRMFDDKGPLLQLGDEVRFTQ